MLDLASIKTSTPSTTTPTNTTPTTIIATTTTFSSPQFTLVDTDDCSVKGDPDYAYEDATDRNCSEFAVDGYRCAPFFACKGGEIIANGVGLVNIRHEDIGKFLKMVPNLTFLCFIGSFVCFFI